jgi:hypothetical protein
MGVRGLQAIGKATGNRGQGILYYSINKVYHKSLSQGSIPPVTPSYTISYKRSYTENMLGAFESIVVH